MTIHILNGPNLNLVGRREPEIYGTVALTDFLDELAAGFGESCTLATFQSNHEGALLDRLHEIGYGPDAGDVLGVVVNFGGLSHTSIALADAIRAIPQPTVEVHLSNVYAREAFRQNSFTAAACRGTITGLGLEGYRLACTWLLSRST